MCGRSRAAKNRPTNFPLPWINAIRFRTMLASALCLFAFVFVFDGTIIYCWGSPLVTLVEVLREVIPQTKSTDGCGGLQKFVARFFCTSCVL